jgi:heme/copper-type cytochrome/quinol oxidase subunit 1
MQKPYHLLLITAGVFFLLSFFVMDQYRVTDLHLHDTYFVIAHTHIFWLAAMLLMLIWVLYLLAGKLQWSKMLTWVHVIITVLAFGFWVFLITCGHRMIGEQPRRYYDFSNWNSSAMPDHHVKTLAVVTGILLCVQLVFFINFLGGLFKRRFS